MTKYIFEDKKDDPLSILFQTSYDAEFVNSHFIYSEGNGKIIKNLDEILKSGEDDIFVIMDLIPDNKETCKIYNMILTRQITLISKSETLLSLYECFPSNSCIDGVNRLGYADIYHVHCELVDKYNEAVKRYSEENPGGHYNRAEYMYMWDRFKT